MDGFDDETFDADYYSFILPNSVDFEGGVAFSYLPGQFTFFKTLVASIPMVQMHEFGMYHFVVVVVVF